MRWVDIPRPIVGLSPMADFTDPPFCRLIRECGGHAVVFREMLAAEAIVRGNARTRESLLFGEDERPLIQQLFGSEPSSMAQAAAMVEDLVKPDGIDINMGCPVPKAVSNFNGASLMRDPEKASVLVRSVKSSISVPLSVKTRLGWSRPDEIVDFVRRLEEAGADAVEVHARTKAQGYSGSADWAAVRPAAESIKIPLLINGDITDVATTQEAIRFSGAQGVLIGRGALGNPWIFKRIESVLQGLEDPGEPTLTERLRVMRRHAELQIERYGEHGLVQLRKHLPWYFKHISGFRQYRAAAVHVSTVEDLDRLIEEISKVGRDT